MAKLLFAALVCVAVGCAGSSSKTAAMPGFDAQDEQLFDNGLDKVQAPGIADGEWGGVFEQRVARADLIALVRIESANTHVDLERRTSHLLNAETLSEIRGQMPSSIALRVQEGQAGFDSIRRNEAELLGSLWVAFIKWEQLGENSSELRARWHLSPNSAGVLEKIAFLMQPPPGETQTKVEVFRE